VVRRHPQTVPVIAYFQKRERARVLANGILVSNGKGVLATWAGETYSCKNPPTGDCTTTEFESMKGNSGVVLSDTGAPPAHPARKKKTRAKTTRRTSRRRNC